jgi:hypothetical protein
LTRFDTGQRCSVSSGAGLNSSMPAAPDSQGSKSFSARSTGMPDDDPTLIKPIALS